MIILLVKYTTVSCILCCNKPVSFFILGVSGWKSINLFEHGINTVVYKLFLFINNLRETKSFQLLFAINNSQSGNCRGYIVNRI